MDIAVQVSPQKESSFLCKSSQINLFSFKDEETTKVSIENQLIFEVFDDILFVFYRDLDRKHV